MRTALLAPITIRASTVADAHAIARIQIESSAAAYRGLIADVLFDGVSVEEREAVWRHRLETGVFHRVLLAARDGRALGFCAVLLPTGDADAPVGVAEIASMYVEPGSWRIGVGTTLLQVALGRLRAGGSRWRAVTLWVFEANAAAQAFYGSCGFVADGSRQTRASLGAPEIRMRLTL